MFDRITIQVHIHDDSLVEVDAMTTRVPGLVVNHDPVCDDDWNVTHVRSGLRVAHAHDPESCFRLVDFLSIDYPDVDWTSNALDVRDAVRAHGSFNYDRYHAGEYVTVVGRDHPAWQR